MSALQRMLIGVNLTKRVLVGIGFAKIISRCWPFKKILVDNGFTSVSKVFTRR